MSDTVTSLDLPPGTPVPLAESEPDGFHVPFPWQSGYGQGYGYGNYFGRGANGSLSDRKAGRFLPVFWNELDLRWYRVLARHLDSTNNFAIGFLSHLVNFVVGKGFGWQACRTGAAKTPYQTVGAPSDPLVTKGQSILDAWRDANKWPVKSRRAYRRLRREGEVFGRFFSGGWDALPAFRFVPPELVGSPDGDTATERSFGIETDPDDVDTVWAFYVRDAAGDGLTGKWVPAEKMVFRKINSDDEVKRGVTDFLPMSAELDGVRLLLRAMLDTSHEQAKMAWMERFPHALVDQVRGMVNKYPANQPDRPRYPDGLPLPWGGNDIRQTYVKRTEGDRELEPGPTFAGVTNYLAVEQACLRGMGARWNMPEYFSGDASNANFASTLVAGSPFVRAIEGEQLEHAADWERPVALKVLDAAVDAGWLTPAERRQLDVEVTPPAVTTPEPDKDATRITGLVSAKLLSPQTAQLQLGLDPQHEEANLQAAEKKAGGSGDDAGLRGTVGGLQAIGQLQQQVYGGQIPREAGVASLQFLFGFGPDEAEAMFPPVQPENTQDHRGGGQDAPPQQDDPPDPAAELLGLSEGNGAKVAKKVTVHRKDGTTFQQTRQVSVGGPGGKDGNPATPDHDPKLAAHAAEQMGEHLPDEVKKNPGLMARLGDALLTVAAKVNLAALRNNHRIMQAVAIAENVFDVPQDMQKFGYAPTMSAQTASADAAAKADPLRTLTADATGVGVGTHLACTIASHVLGRLSVWAKNKVSGAKTEGAEDADWAGLAEVVAAVFAAVNDALGMEGAPDAAAVEAKLREMFAKE